MCYFILILCILCLIALSFLPPPPTPHSTALVFAIMQVCNVLYCFCPFIIVIVFFNLRHGNCVQKCSFYGSETDSVESTGKRNWGYNLKKNMEAPVLVLHQTPTKHTHVAIAHLSHLIVNTAAGCHFSRDALSLNAVILTRFCTMFQLRKSECSESFESEKFTMMVAWVPNHCEMFNECGCASKCEWASVNGRWIGLVGQRCENLVGCLKFHLYVQFF